MSNPLLDNLADSSLEHTSYLITKHPFKSEQQIKQFIKQLTSDKQATIYNDILQLVNKDPLNQQHYCHWIKILISMNINLQSAKKFQPNLQNKLQTTSSLIRLKGKLQAVTNQHQYQQQLQQHQYKQKSTSNTAVHNNRMIQYQENQTEPFQTDSEDDQLQVDRKKSIEYIQKDSSDDYQNSELQQDSQDQEDDQQDMEIEENSEWD